MSERGAEWVGLGSVRKLVGWVGSYDGVGLESGKQVAGWVGDDRQVGRWMARYATGRRGTLQTRTTILYRPTYLSTHQPTHPDI